MSITGNVERGSIVWCNPHPTKGHEQNGYRTSIVLSDGFIDSSLNKMALTVPQGIKTNDSNLLPPQLHFPELMGVVLINNVRAIVLDKRDAIVIGKVDTESEFFQEIIDNVMGLMAYPEEDEKI